VTLGPVEFRSPVWLLLIPALWALAWLISRRSLAGLGAATRRAAVSARFLVFALLAAALAEPAWRTTAEDVAVSVLVDVTPSVPVDARRDAVERIERAAAEARPNDRLGVITAAKEPLVQRLPSARERIIELGDPGESQSTNLAAAVRLALASAPDDAALRLLLVSDGVETEGSLRAAAESAAAAGVPIDVAPIDYSIDREVIVDSLVTPTTARQGETVNARFVITSTAPTVGRLSLRLNGSPIDLDPDSPGVSAPVELEAGANIKTVPIALPSTGPQRFEAFFEPGAQGDDAIAQNNAQSAVTFVSGEGRVLVYSDDPTASQHLVQALIGSGLSVEIRPTSRAHRSLIDLGAYDAVVMIDTPAYAFSQAQQEELRTYVHDLGGGLVKVGGPDSFGAGGWIGSPLADALPVKLDPPQRRVMPKGALAIVLDASGSMFSPIAGGVTKQEAANEAAALAVNSLSRLDIVTVIVFSGWHEVVIPPVEKQAVAGEVERRIRSAAPGGGTWMYPAIDEALKQLASVNASAKHVILLTDGQSTGNPSRGVNTARRMQEEKITLSTVAVGAGADTNLLQHLAGVGGGRFYTIATQAELDALPQIFIKEAQTVKRPLIWEGDPFPPQLVNVAAAPMRGVGSVPPLSGYVVAADREGLSLTTLRGQKGDPILAQWQYGLGRAVAFTSDATNRWSPQWVAWPQYDAFWAQHVRWAMRPSGSANLTVFTERRGDQTRIIVEALDAAGERMNFARFQGRAVGPDGESQAIDLRQTGPGRYEGTLRADDPGAYVLNVGYRAPRSDGSVERGSVRAAVVRAAADEHRSLRSNEALLREVAEITSGRILPRDLENADLFSRDGLTMPVAAESIWLAVALAALGLFVVDVGVRRVRIDLAAIAAWVGRAVSRAPEAKGEPVGALRAARERTAQMLETRGSGAAATSGGGQSWSARRKNVAGAKFEAAEGERPSIPLSGAARESATAMEDEPAPVKKQRLPEPEQQAGDQEEGGMSRLLKAKRRARDEMSEEDQ